MLLLCILLILLSDILFWRNFIFHMNPRVGMGAWLKRYNTVMTRTLIYYGYNQYFYYISKNYKNLKYSSRVSVIGSCHFLNTPQTNAPQHNSNTTKNHLKHPLKTRNTPQTPKTFLKHPLNTPLTPKTPLKHSSNTPLTPL